ncbi:hypothetical protein AMELA_G00229550 [Ameiurus melas]|uniref:Uncharacterized protein n=1 Tax=Ameiurus melas TaxID=219545 RepID=A0A7J6A0I2_AMEME|nr:hypothetical protein AMELA_G00229550 [Ameiurus melas]
MENGTFVGFYNYYKSANSVLSLKGMISSCLMKMFKRLATGLKISLRLLRPWQGVVAQWWEVVAQQLRRWTSDRKAKCL